MLTIISTVVIIGTLIFIHELGHFLAAKRAGVLVQEFALGFGPRLIGMRRGETTYSLRALPLGGFVKMAGMHPDEESYKQVEPERRFLDQPVLDRISIILAGPVANLLLAILLFAGLFGIIGISVPTTEIAEVEPGFPAAAAGLRSGDEIVAVDGQPVAGWDSLVEHVRGHPEREIALTIRRAGVEQTVSLVPARAEEGYGVIGIRPQLTQQRYGVVAAIGAGLEWTARVIGAFFDAVAGAVTGRGTGGEILGPVGIGAEIGAASRRGLPDVLFLAALLSANLGLINLLPVPALDGSRLVFLAVEGLRGRPLDPDKEGMVHLVGFALMLALLVVVSVRDVIRIF